MSSLKWAILTSGLLAFVSGTPFLHAQEMDPGIFNQLRYRHIGPPGNRTAAVVGVPGDISTYYIGASSGGIWKSDDAALNWKPVFDDQPVQSIGALAIASSDHAIVWAGTGEAFIRSNISIGNGVYKSLDAGKTWQHMGLDLTGRIGRIIIHPSNPDIVLVAALGHCYGPQKERGVFRTEDGGKTWQHVLFTDENTGCFEIAMDPSNPRNLLAGMWPLEIHTYGRTSGGPNGGIWRSRDGGITWNKQTGNGLPEAPVGKIGLAWSHSNPKVVYAIIETGSPNRGVLWKSSDGGDSWDLVSKDRLLNERSHYASRIMVNPADENEIYFAANTHSVSYDGGQTTEQSGWSGDSHDMWADPLLPDRMMISDDGGVQITLNRGKSWNRISLPIAQMYHVAVDNQVPYFVYGGMQDGNGYKGPGMSGGWRGYNPEDWKSTAGGECGFIIPDPVDPNIVWGGSYNSDFTKIDYRTGHQQTVKIWPESNYGSSAGELTYRFNWTFPIHISPHDHNTVYAGSQFVHRTTDGGNSWEVISPDLSTSDPERMKTSGGLTEDNIGVEYACLVFAIAESRAEKGCIWAGTNDGLVHVTRDAGKTWTNVTKNVPGLPAWGTVSNLEPSRYDAATCYMTVDFHQMNNRDPFVYKTSNYGKTWKLITSGIAKSVFSYCHWIHEDPVRKGLLFLGTENAIYVSFTDGESWIPFQGNLPHAPVHHMVVQEHFNDLVVGTYGRGFWIMDDITPLQQLTPEVLKSGFHLFNPRPAYRFHPVSDGQSANSSASINYYLKDSSASKVTVEILDSADSVVTTLSGKSGKGINRVTWGLRYNPPQQVKLRVKPAGNPSVVEEKRYRDTWTREGWYPFQSWGTGGGFSGILAPPGKYTIRVKSGEKTYTSSLTINKDPRSAGTPDDISKTFTLQQKLRADIDGLAGMINRMEWIRKQVVDLQQLIKSGAGNKIVADALLDLDKKISAVEDHLLQPVSREGDTKSFRYANRLYEKLSVLAGDVADNVDFAPTASQFQVYAKLRAEFDLRSGEFNRLLKNDLPGLNQLLAENKLSGIMIP